MWPFFQHKFIVSLNLRKQSRLRFLTSVLVLSQFLFVFHFQADAQKPFRQNEISGSDLTNFDLKIQDLQQQLEELRAHQTELIESSGSVLQTQAEDNLIPPIFKLETDTTRSKYPDIKLKGFFQTDAIFFAQDTGNIQAVGDIQNGADFRRARLAAAGKVWENVKVMLEMDFAGSGRPSFTDIWFDIEDISENTSLKIGRYRQPIGMDGLTSSKEITFMERSLPFAFLPFRQIGAMAFGHSDDEQMTWALSGFRYPTDVYGGNIGDSGGFGLATRATKILIDDPAAERLLHIGGGYSFAYPANDLIRYRNQPEIVVSETPGATTPVGVLDRVPPFVDTGLIPTQNYNLFSGELAFVTGPFYAQSEILCSVLRQENGEINTLHGAYAYFGYFLTGESRPYKRTSGVFGRVIPNDPFNRDGGSGAWEIAGRWSYLNLNSKSIQGGSLTDLTLGLNWYWNQYTRFEFNYIHAFLNSSPVVYGPIVRNSNADIFGVRAQIDF
ncbi:MAG TPA: porin [Planctomycetaceae bacterium]|uniref:OprO/OprP family phosphate-selective porin n=3 Tax=Gimesia TaxID=1649453 RepID=UPI000C4DCBB5|nr:porin [Gimesia sp.]MAX36786.1 porin [Gimesia sp.]HAH45270.1 porin [Planctomycetaceae bacterium]|tara:strand:- start:2623 stop:4116 length:1494 start_codon:yes stop_codon:yes gene_type:complete